MNLTCPCNKEMDTQRNAVIDFHEKKKVCSNLLSISNRFTVTLKCIVIKLTTHFQDCIVDLKKKKV